MQVRIMECGNTVWIDYGNGIKGVCYHLYKDSMKVSVGDKVEYGQVIAKLGHTGDSTGPHLHFFILKDDNYVDSTLYVNPKDPRPTASGTTDYSFNGNDYSVLENVNNVKSTIDSKGYCQDVSGHTDACLGFAYVYADAVTTGDTSNIKSSSSVQSGVRNNGDITGKYSTRIVKESKSEIVKLIYDQLNSGKSCVMKVVGSYNNSNPASPRSRHYVAAIGYKKGVDRNSIKDTDLLLLDTWDGKIKPVVTEYTSGRYLLDGRKASYGYSEAYEIFISN